MMNTIPDVNWSRIGAFIRQHTHDLRNELNGLDLEASLLAEIVVDAEAQESVARIRAQVRHIVANLRVLSGRFAEARPNLARFPAQELFASWQDQLAALPTRPEVEWASTLGDAEVNVDPSAVVAALHELLVNAHSFGTGGRLRGSAAREDGEVIFQLHEPKAESVDPAQWGLRPFVSTRRGGYGLGLCEVRKIIEASGGTISWRFDDRAAELVTTIRFPAA
jgi:signal transduction histidine kinase